ncbi:MAG: 3-dehydroquinate synthase [Proteobacteria bacterium]|nr:3-dehydroquinate synthase [Pseudomonadota bacterium]
MQTLSVDLGHTRYPIHIGSGLLSDASVWNRGIAADSILVVSSSTIAPLYLEHLKAGLAGRHVAQCILPDGESNKTLSTASWVIDALVGNKVHRDGLVIALGGGVVGDVAGFAAACYQRGIAFVQAPTTLLAQVDSSVGGKTGVNHPGGKNLIGAYHQPIAVVTDTDTLATLPDRELRAGLAEVIKYGCVWDPIFFDWLALNVGALLARDPEALAYAIARSCEIKAKVVGQDERETGVRAILNFGHTFGHAIEVATHYKQYLHGEAVALGMIMAAELSRRLAMIDGGASARIRELVAAAGLPTEIPRIGTERVLELMRMDKKVLAGNVRLVLLEKLGRAVVIGHYEQGALETMLREQVG